MKILIYCILLSGCSSSYFDDDFKSEELVSSKGEHIYINSYNWGVTGDKQLSIISTDKNRLKDPQDTLGAVFGLEPFFYSFKHDTLKLFFQDEISYRIKEDFKTITVSYIILNSKKYQVKRQESWDDKETHAVPRKVDIKYPADKPLPPPPTPPPPGNSNN